MHYLLRKKWLAEAFRGQLPEIVQRKKVENATLVDESKETPLLDTAYEDNMKVGDSDEAA